MRQSLDIGFGLDQCDDCLIGGYRVNQTGAGGEGRTGRHAKRPAHAGTPTDDHHSSPVTLMVMSPKWTLPVDCLEVVHHGRTLSLR
jgi:hypothetical protein